MDRCKLFSKLTRSNDEECTLFEELLESFFEEYSSLYGGLLDGEVVNDVANIICEEHTKYFKAKISFYTKVVTEEFVLELEKYIEKRAPAAFYNVDVSMSSGDTILIEIRKG